MDRYINKIRNILVECMPKYWYKAVSYTHLGLIDEERLVMETMLSMKRAGAKIIITYHACLLYTSRCV